MSKIERNGNVYVVEYSTARIQPMFIINDYIIGVGFWKDDEPSVKNKLLYDAIEVYEYHKKNGTLVETSFYLHEPPLKPKISNENFLIRKYNECPEFYHVWVFTVILSGIILYLLLFFKIL